MALEGKAPVGKQPVGEEVQLARGGDVGVEHPDAPGGRIARVGKAFSAFLFLLAVQFLKGPAGHDAFTADLEVGREAQLLPLLRIDPQGNGADGLHVGGHVFAGGAVAPGDAPDQRSILVKQRQAQSIEFVLRGVIDRLAPRPFPHPAVELAKLIEGGHIVQAQHHLAMFDLDEALPRLPAHPLRGGIRRHQARVPLLQLLEVLHQLVEFGVGDLRVIEHVVAVLVVADLLAELLDLFFNRRLALGFHLGHAERPIPAEDGLRLHPHYTDSPIVFDGGPAFFHNRRAPCLPPGSATPP